MLQSVHWNRSFSLYLSFVISFTVDFSMTSVWFLYFLYVLVHTHIKRLDFIIWMTVSVFTYMFFYNFYLNFSHGENRISVLCSFFLFSVTSRTLFFIFYCHHLLNYQTMASYAWIWSSISVFGSWKNNFL